MTFLCSDYEPRQFLLSRWLETDSREGPSRFLEDTCRCGFKILNVLEAGLGYSPTDGQLWSHLFRNRNAGNIAVTRAFNAHADFMAYDHFSRKHYWIVAGLPELVDGPSDETLSEYEMKTKIARRTLVKAFAGQSCENTIDDLVLLLRCGC